MFDLVRPPMWAIALTAGLLGAGCAWYVQGLRIDAVQAEFDSFVATTKAQGEVAAELALKRTAEDKRKKELIDNVYNLSVASLNADIKRLRDARASSRFVPAAPAAPGSTSSACFDRAELERTLQQLDSEVSGIVAEGDESALALNVARMWASDQRGHNGRQQADDTD